MRGTELGRLKTTAGLDFRSRVKAAQSSSTGGRFKLPLALGKHRSSKLCRASGGGGDGDAESTSSGESTPQKSQTPAASSMLIKPAGVPMPRPMSGPAAVTAAAAVRRGAEATKPHPLKPHKGLGPRKKRLFFGGSGGGNSGESSCSSAMSSLESIRSNASDGVQGRN